MSKRIDAISAKIASIENQNPYRAQPGRTAGTLTSSSVQATRFNQAMQRQTLTHTQLGQGLGQGSLTPFMATATMPPTSVSSLAPSAVGVSSQPTAGALNQAPFGLGSQSVAGLIAKAGVGAPAGGGLTLSPFMPMASPVPSAAAMASTYGVNQTPQWDLAAQLRALPPGTHPTAPAQREQKVPLPLQSLGNGKLPAQVLESVGVGDHQLWSPAAKAFKALRAAAERDGVTIGVNSSYRDVACQQCMVDKYGRFDQGGRAAPPGKSNHGWGLSIDLQLDAKAKAWMREHARNYGFVNDVAREPWHWTFVADQPPTLSTV